MSIEAPPSTYRTLPGLEFQSRYFKKMKLKKELSSGNEAKGSLSKSSSSTSLYEETPYDSEQFRICIGIIPQFNKQSLINVGMICETGWLLTVLSLPAQLVSIPLKDTSQDTSSLLFLQAVLICTSKTAKGEQRRPTGSAVYIIILNGFLFPASTHTSIMSTSLAMKTPRDPQSQCAV